MCNRIERRVTDKVLNLFGAKLGVRFNEGPLQVHPQRTRQRHKTGRWRARVGAEDLGIFPDTEEKIGTPIRPRPVNNARFAKLDTSFCGYWSLNPKHHYLIPTLRYAEAVGLPDRRTTRPSANSKNGASGRSATPQLEMVAGARNHHKLHFSDYGLADTHGSTAIFKYLHFLDIARSLYQASA